jgi:ubiquinone/menaquinone biosynthesis C-methylase UbiE
VRTREAVELIRPAVSGRDGTWADFGAGSGTFTRALAELLGPESRIFAVDRDAAALDALRRALDRKAHHVIVVTADFTRPFNLPGLEGAKLDGMLLANALHFVDDPAPVLARLTGWLRPAGRVAVVEYDRRGPNRWVPHPLPAARWPEVVIAAGLTSPAVVARRPSTFGGDLYVGTAERNGSALRSAPTAPRPGTRRHSRD